MWDHLGEVAVHLLQREVCGHFDILGRLGDLLQLRIYRLDGESSI